jgi:hypothetical protein
MVPRRYDVHWVTLDPGRGSELRKNSQIRVHSCAFVISSPGHGCFCFATSSTDEID